MNWRDKYIGKFFAEGSYGEVYELYEHGQPVNKVLKVLKSKHDPEDRRRLLREIHCLKELKECPYIIDILDWSEQETELPWFVMPKADYSLYDYVVKRKGLTEKECIFISRCVLLALKEAHSKNILHRDLGATNVLLFKNRDGFQVKVADFSLGRDFRRESILTRKSQANLGQDAFVAPEQLQNLNNASELSDIYAVGSLMSFMLTASDPRYETPNSTLGPIIAQFREKDPQRRPQNVTDALRLLDLFESITNKGIQLDINEIKNQFDKDGFLSEEAYHHLTYYLTRENPIFNGYKQGNLTYNRYFVPLIHIQDLLAYWAKISPKSNVQLFYRRLSEQLDTLVGQTNWNFRDMFSIGEMMMKLFYANDDLKPLIFESLIDVRNRGFGEVYHNIIQILSQEYSNPQLITSLSVVLNRYKDDLADIYQDIRDRIRHMAFVEVFEGS